MLRRIADPYAHRAVLKLIDQSIYGKIEHFLMEGGPGAERLALPGVRPVGADQPGGIHPGARARTVPGGTCQTRIRTSATSPAMTTQPSPSSNSPSNVWEVN